MASERQYIANRRNAQQSCGPKSEAGKRASSVNARKHGLSASEPSALDDPTRDVLLADARARGYGSEAAEILIHNLFKHRQVYRAYAEIYARDMQERGAPQVESTGRVRRMTPDDLMNAWVGLTDEGVLTPHREQVVQALLSGVEIGDVLSDTTVDTLRGLERYLQRASAQLLKAARQC